MTLLFTDIEGSTRLLRAAGAAGYADLQGVHRHKLREAAAMNGGTEVDNQGDAFFFVFPEAIGAIRAARDGTSALHTYPWAPGLEIKVRMGLHVGNPILTAEGYVGEDVNKGARIAALGAGGQILASQTLVDEIEPERLATGSFVDLGLHRLKDFDSLERLYQMGSERFPAIQSVGSSNLPVPTTRFVGRQDELYDALCVVLDEDPPLLTIHGPGGVGKTRFSIELARLLEDQHPGGTWFVEMGPVADPRDVLPSIARSLDAPRQGDRALVDAILDRIGSKPSLLLLDNMEHLAESATSIVELLEGSPSLRVVATSRLSLHVSAERLFELAPLDTTTSRSLFMARARATRTVDYRDLDELCARLDHLPLAIEFAAARTDVLTVPEIIDAVAAHPTILQGERDRSDRTITLPAVVRWSVDLLSREQRDAFHALSIFPGGCTLEMAAALCDATPETVAALVNASLVRHASEGPVSRYSMLETVRATAIEDLERSPGSHKVRTRFIRWARSMVDRAVDGGLGQAALAAEADNLLAATVLAHRSGDLSGALAILEGAWSVWLFSGHAAEAGRAVDAMIDDPAPISDVQRHEALAIGGEFARFQGGLERALELKRTAIKLAERASLPAQDLAADLHDVAEILAVLGLFEEAETASERGILLRRDLGEPSGLGHALQAAASVAEARGDWARAVDIMREAVTLQTNEDWRMWLELMLAYDLVHLERSEEALAAVAEWMDHPRIQQNLAIFDVALSTTATIAALADRPIDSHRLFAAAEAVRRHSGLSQDPIQALDQNALATFDAQTNHREWGLWSSCSMSEALELLRHSVRELQAFGG